MAKILCNCSPKLKSYNPLFSWSPPTKCLIALLSIMLLPSLTLVGQSLNKPLIESYYAALKQQDRIEAQFSEVFEKAEKDFSPLETQKIIQYLKASPAHQVLKSGLTLHGFNSLEEFFDVWVKLVVSQFEVLVTRHARESGHPEICALDSRLRGNDNVSIAVSGAN